MPKIWFHVINYGDDKTTAFGFSAVNGIIVDAPYEHRCLKGVELTYARSYFASPRVKVYKVAEQVIKGDLDNP